MSPQKKHARGIEARQNQGHSIPKEKEPDVELAPVPPPVATPQPRKSPSVDNNTLRENRSDNRSYRCCFNHICYSFGGK